MQPPPTASDLLAVVAEVLADEVVPALSGPIQHHARVAASLVAIVERELRLATASDAAERAAVAQLLGVDPDRDERGLAGLRSALATQLREGLADDPDDAGRVWETLMASTRADLRIARPGHDAWEGD